ncbi:hypothetical protein F3Y22_tig00110055pilonHSYRG00019 [Hibiscus syriacus]|uniref:RNase H type-1 domain-containing protein n=1 Tax=Hibiscus syriacus TaxID=106335 RepID=A0A6A3BPC6_HIBSY|nr:hypothetical protein F3Y22_tig00110055pilonHSYRG00019 [Hibiscus syriacus]
MVQRKRLGKSRNICNFNILISSIKGGIDTDGKFRILVANFGTDAHGSIDTNGFNQHLGSSTVLHSVLWSVLDGLKLAWHRGYRHLLLQLDSMEAFEMVASATHDSPISLIRSIFDLLNSDWRMNLKLILCEANMAADFWPRLMVSPAAISKSTTIVPQSYLEFYHVMF